MATLFRMDGWVKSAIGNAIPGSQVYVCTQPAVTTALPPSPLASIFSDPAGMNPITQPILADGFGHYDFYAASGTYTVVIGYYNVLQQVYPDQSIAPSATSSGLIAGTGINITSNVVSINLVAGSGISIAGNVISSTASGGVTSVGLSAPGSVFSVSGSPITGSGTLGLSFISQAQNSVFAGPASGGSGAPVFRALQASDLPGGMGTVTSFSSGNLSPLFTSSVANPTTTPALTFSLSTQTANTFFVGPTSGGAVAPTFRSMVIGDLPAGATSIPTSGGVSAPSPLWDSAAVNIQSIAAASTLNLTLASVDNTTGSTTVYHGTITGGASNGLAGASFTIAGFTTSANNGTFFCTASTTSTLTLANSAGASETHAATANLSYAVAQYTISSTSQFASNALQGAVVNIVGASNSANNGQFLCTFSTATVVYVDNASGVLQGGAAGTLQLYEAFSGTGITPEIYVQDINGTWHEQFGIDTTTTVSALSGTGPTGPAGTLTCGRRIYFRDSLASTQSGKNAFISVNHTSGRGTSNTNQDRAIWVSMQNDSASSDTLYGMEGIQVEVDCVGSPTFQAAVDGEVAAISAQMSDQHTGTVGSPNYGCIAGRFQYYREAGAGNWGSVSPAAIRAISTNFSTVNGGGMTIVGLDVQVTDGTGAPSNISGVAVNIKAPTGFLTSNRGIFMGNFGTGTGDFAIESLGGQCLIQGPVGVGSIFPASTTAGGLVAITGGASCEGLLVNKLAAPANALVTPVGVTGATTYTYVVVAYDPNGGAVASVSQSTTMGNAALSMSNYNQLELGPNVAIGPTTFKVFRTVGGATQGAIATLTPAGQNYASGGTLLVNDTGLAGDSTTPPSVNSSGTIVAQGPITPGMYAVAGLPAGVEGQHAYATNGRKVGEGGGAGTGVPVYYSAAGPAGAGWYVYSSAALVAA